jgi:hypothetical protein
VTENLYIRQSFVSFFMDRLMSPTWWVIGLINANYISNYLGCDRNVRYLNPQLSVAWRRE